MTVLVFRETREGTRLAKVSGSRRIMKDGKLQLNLNKSKPIYSSGSAETGTGELCQIHSTVSTKPICRFVELFFLLSVCFRFDQGDEDSRQISVNPAFLFYFFSSSHFPC